MHRSLLTQSHVNALLAQACQNKENDQQLMPVVFLANGTKDLRILPLPDLAADADDRRAQFYAIGKKYPDTTEAVFICETWFVNALKTADAFKVMPSEHPGRQEAVVLSGRNRSSTNSLCILQGFDHADTGISWQPPQVFTNPEFPLGPIDLIFAP